MRVSATLEFESVYRHSVAYVFTALRRLGVRPEELDDAAQEVYVVVHRRLPEFDPLRGTMRGWMSGIVRGVAANRRRSTERRTRTVPPAPPLDDRRSDPELGLRHRQLLELVEEFLCSLPKEQRDVFELCECEGLRGPEAARVLGVNLNTVYTRLRAARLSFKQHIASLGAEDVGAHG